MITADEYVDNPARGCNDSVQANQLTGKEHFLCCYHGLEEDPVQD